MLISFSLLHKSAIHFDKEPQLKIINFQIEILILTGKKNIVVHRTCHSKKGESLKIIWKCKKKDDTFQSINYMFCRDDINALLQSQGNLLFEKIFRTMSVKSIKNQKFKMPFNWSQRVKNLLAAIFSMSSSWKLLTE